jgi:hypothetical protein
MADHPFNTLETLYECLERMEAALMGMKQMRHYIGRAGPGKELLESLIEEAEWQLADIKRKVIQ